MEEKKNNSNVQMLEEEDLDKVSGGGFFSTYDEQEYRDAGLDFEWGVLWNGTYTLRTSGEELSWNEAENAVIYKKYMGRPASSKAEINRFMRDDWPRLSGADGSGYPNMHD
jgi:hypothetical protein